MFKNYLKLAFKVLLRRKMFTFINLFGICFTLTILLAATAVYTSSIISNPIEKNLSKTLILRHVEFSNAYSKNFGPASAYIIESSVKPLHHIENISVHNYSYEQMTIYIQSERLDIDVQSTDHNFWKILSFEFIEGHPYLKEEVESGQKVVIICESLRNRIFGQKSALNKNIILKQDIYKIIGVVKDVPKLYQSAYAQVWRPIDYASYMTQVSKKDLNSFIYSAILLAKSRSYFTAIRQEFAQNIMELKPLDKSTVHAPLESSFDITFGPLIYPAAYRYSTAPFSFYLKLILEIVALLLLFLMIPLLNLMNLTLSRILERSSEIGVRKAFGATMRQMTLQFMYENLVITSIGGILSFGGAWLLLWTINAIGIVQFGIVTFHFRIFLYGMAIIILFGVISGLYPAKRMSKLQISEIMKGGNK